MISKAVDKLTIILMIGLFLSIPITNFPFFPSIMGKGVLVRPLMFYPVAGLVLTMILPRLIKKPLPRPIVIIFLFFLWGLIVSLLPPIKNVISPMKEVPLISREIRTMITLSLGLIIYLAISIYPQDLKEFKSTIKWLYAGLILVLIWASLQAIYILNLIPGWFDLMSKVQTFISVKPLNPGRASGMTYEPSAFADQLVVIWLPWILSASINNYSVFQWRWKWITIERILGVWSLGVLALTLSKTGLILGVGLILFGFFLNLVNPFSTDDSHNKDDHHRESKDNLLRKYRFLIIPASIVLFIAIFYSLGTRVPYISRIWDFFIYFDDVNLRRYLVFIGFGSRITYWETAWKIFLEYPVTGVGMGNYGIYFSDFIPYQKLAFTPELFLRLVPAVNRSRVASAKHFLLRILAEMGIVGFGFFLAFLVVLGLMGLYLWRSRKLEERFLGTASLIGLFAFLGDTFSFDSYAIPNPWVLFGLITAGFTVITKTHREVSENE